VKCLVTPAICPGATEGGGQWAEWDLFITLEGKKAYHIGNVCGTCAFFFERLPGANDKLSAKVLSARLRRGLNEIDESVVRTATAALPAGSHVQSRMIVAGEPAPSLA
jgi:hypothetical protein